MLNWLYERLTGRRVWRMSVPVEADRRTRDMAERLGTGGVPVTVGMSLAILEHLVACCEEGASVMVVYPTGEILELRLATFLMVD